MFDRITLERLIQEYEQKRKQLNKKPSYDGLANALNVSDTTIKHILKGVYKEDKPYTDKPQYNRCIDNRDFDLIIGVFI